MALYGGELKGFPVAMLFTCEKPVLAGWLNNFCWRYGIE